MKKKHPIVESAVYSDREVALLIGVSVNTIYSWRQHDKHRPKAVKVGKLRKTSGRAILDFLDSCPIA